MKSPFLLLLVQNQSEIKCDESPLSYRSLRFRVSPSTEAFGSIFLILENPGKFFLSSCFF
ncbi:unnamed protein product [Brassica rapa subsp. narinosa]